MSDCLPTHEEITRYAYAIYLEEGCPPNRELAHWLEAEEQLTIDKMHDAFARESCPDDSKQELQVGVGN